jgi:hypothetical protein
LVEGDTAWIVIKPESLLWHALPGKICADEVQIGKGPIRKIFTVVVVVWLICALLQKKAAISAALRFLF